LSNCVFCNISEERIINEYKHYLIIRDSSSVTSLHSLVIPKRHIVSYFECNKDEDEEIPIVLHTQKTELKLTDDSIIGFNIGMNIGKDARQTVFHFHIHIIPRRKGDIENPRGGIRGVILGKQKY
jgi:ATP adenylyltransferase